MKKELTLPILTIWLFCFHRDLEHSGKYRRSRVKNMLKIAYGFLPEKIKKIIDGIEENSSGNRAHKDER